MPIKLFNKFKNNSDHSLADKIHHNIFTVINFQRQCGKVREVDMIGWHILEFIHVHVHNNED